MPFGPNGEHVTVRLIDFDDLERTSTSSRPSHLRRRARPRSASTWCCWSTASRCRDRGEDARPARARAGSTARSRSTTTTSATCRSFFVPNVFSFATEGKELRYGSIALPVELWGPWRAGWATRPAWAGVEKAASVDAATQVLLDILANFTAFATDKKHRKIKIIARYQQYEAANQIVERVVAGHQEGPHLALPGLGQVAADGLRRAEAAAPSGAEEPDRADRRRPHRPRHPDHRHLQRRRRAEPGHDRQPRRAADAARGRTRGRSSSPRSSQVRRGPGVLNDRDNIIAMVDEAHRTQEGDLGRKMREALPNAFLFGLTGTPINKRDRNTFYAFGAEEDERGYMSRYCFEESIRDGATLPLHFEPRLSSSTSTRRRSTRRSSELDRGSARRQDHSCQDGREDGVLVKTPSGSRRSAPTSPSTSRTRSSRTASRRRSSSTTARPASSTRRRSTSTCRRRRRPS